jgi:hypothetical protein
MCSICGRSVPAVRRWHEFDEECWPGCPASLLSVIALLLGCSVGRLLFLLRRAQGDEDNVALVCRGHITPEGVSTLAHILRIIMPDGIAVLALSRNEGILFAPHQSWSRICRTCASSPSRRRIGVELVLWGNTSQAMPLSPFTMILSTLFYAAYNRYRCSRGPSRPIRMNRRDQLERRRQLWEETALVAEWTPVLIVFV